MRRAPQRRLTLTLSIGADSWKDLRCVMDEIQSWLKQQKVETESLRCGTAGVSAGWHLELEARPEQSAEGYQKDLADYLQAKRERSHIFERRKKPC